MPVARFQMPDGRIGRFEVPEGTSPEDAQSMIESSLGGNITQPPAADPTPAPAPAAPEPTFMSRMTENVAHRKQQMEALAQDAVDGTISQPEALARQGLKAAQLLPDAIGSGIAQLTPDFIKDPLSDAAHAVANTDTARYVVGEANDFAANHPVAAGRIGSVLDIANLAAPLAPFSGKSAFSTATDLAQDGAKVGLRTAAKAVTPTISQDTAALAQKALDYGIPLRASQLSDSRFAKTVASVTKGVPLSGARSFENTQVSAFNRAVAKTIGQDADALTPEVIQAAHKDIGAKFNNVFAGRKVAVTDELVNGLATLESEAQQSLTGDHYKIVSNWLNKFTKDVERGGTIPGDRINSYRSALTKQLSRTNNDAAPFLQDLQSLIVDASVNGLPGGGAKLQEARLQWKNLKTIEPLVAKAEGGYISPSLLQGAVTNSKAAKSYHARGMSGELGDLARIGQAFLKDKIPNSGTTERLIASGALPTSFLAPVSTASSVLGAKAFTMLDTAQPRVAKAVQNALKTDSPFAPSPLYLDAAKTAAANGASAETAYTRAFIRRYQKQSAVVADGGMKVDFEARSLRKAANRMHTTGQTFLDDHLPEIVSSGKLGEFQPVDAAKESAKGHILGYYPLYSEIETAQGPQSVYSKVAVKKAESGGNNVHYLSEINKVAPLAGTKRGSLVPAAIGVSAGYAARPPLQAGTERAPAAIGAHGLTTSGITANEGPEQNNAPFSLISQAQASEASTAPGYFQKLGQVESGGNYDAQAGTSSAFGKYQITKGTAQDLIRKHGQALGVNAANWKTPAGQDRLATALTRDNHAGLLQYLGRHPTSAELYTAHFLGLDGARKALDQKNAFVPAARLFPQFARANRAIFYDGKRPRSVFEMNQLLQQKIGA